LAAKKRYSHECESAQHKFNPAKNNAGFTSTSFSSGYLRNRCLASIFSPYLYVAVAGIANWVS
jgi:hypothetical protein